MTILADLIVAALLVVAAVRGSKRGFILTLCGFLAIFVALIGANIVSGLLCDQAAQAIRPALEEKIGQELYQYVQQQGPQGEQPQQEPELTEEEEESFSMDQVLQALGESKLLGGFVEDLRKAVDQGVLEVTASAAAAVSAYLAREIARMVIFAVSFVLILVVWFLVSHALDLAFRLPILNSLNRGLGGAMGLVRGAALLWIAGWLLGSMLPRELVEGTVLVRFFCTQTPFTVLAALAGTGRS